MQFVGFGKLRVILFALVFAAINPAIPVSVFAEEAAAVLTDPASDVIYRGRCVRDEDGKPILGATVRFYAHQQYSAQTLLSFITKTDRDGRFAIRFSWDKDRMGQEIFYSRSQIAINAPGRASTIGLWTKSADEVTHRMQAAVELTGRLTDSDGVPIADGIVRLGKHTIPGVYDAVTDDDGRYVIDDLAPWDEFQPVAKSLDQILTASHPMHGSQSSFAENVPGEQDIAFEISTKMSRNTKMRVVSQAGTHQMVGGVTMTISGEVFHGADVHTTAMLRWPATSDRPALEHKISVASDAFANREKWVVVWRQDRAQLWLASSMREDPYVRAVDFSDPYAIVGFTQGRWVGQTTNSADAAVEIHDARLRGLIGDDKKNGIPIPVKLSMSSVFPKLREKAKKADMLSSASVVGANYQSQWQFAGMVRDQKNEGLPGVLVEVRDSVKDGPSLARATTGKDGSYKLAFRTPMGSRGRRKSSKSYRN